MKYRKTYTHLIYAYVYWKYVIKIYQLLERVF